MIGEIVEFYIYEFGDAVPFNCLKHVNAPVKRMEGVVVNYPQVLNDMFFVVVEVNGYFHSIGTDALRKKMYDGFYEENV